MLCDVSVPGPKPTPARISFSVFPHVILEVICALDEVWDEISFSVFPHVILEVICAADEVWDETCCVKVIVVVTCGLLSLVLRMCTLYTCDLVF